MLKYQEQLIIGLKIIFIRTNYDTRTKDKGTDTICH